MTNAFNIDELILRVLDGVATPDEIQTLAQWLKASPENEVYFNQLKKSLEFDKWADSFRGKSRA